MFLSVLRAHTSDAYRFELARMRAGRGALRRWGAPLAAATYTVSAFWLASEPWDERVMLTLSVVCLVLLVALVVGACSAGVRAFGGERANGTLDALVMAPVARDELVLGRLLARGRTPRLLFLAYSAATLGASLYVMLENAHWRSDWWWEELQLGLVVLGALSLHYLSLLVLGASLGLVLGLRLRGIGAALAAAIAAVLVLVAVETFGAALWGYCMEELILEPSRLYRRLNDVVIALLMLGGVLLFAAANLVAGLLLVPLCIRRFDHWSQDP